MRLWRDPIFDTFQPYLLVSFNDRELEVKTLLKTIFICTSSSLLGSQHRTSNVLVSLPPLPFPTPPRVGSNLLNLYVHSVSQNRMILEISVFVYSPDFKSRAPRRPATNHPQTLRCQSTTFHAEPHAGRETDTSGIWSVANAYRIKSSSRNTDSGAHTG